MVSLFCIRLIAVLKFLALQKMRGGEGLELILAH